MFLGLLTKKEANARSLQLAKKAAEFTFNNIARFPTNSQIVYGFNDAADDLKAYVTNEDVYSIVRKVAGMCKRIPLLVYEVRNKKALTRYRIMQKNASDRPTNKSIWDAKEWQTKALELVGEDDELQQILDNPNSTQSKDEFYEAAYSLPLLTGNDYIWLNALDAGANKGKLFSKEGDFMIHLPPDVTHPIASRTLPNRVLYYQMLMGTIMNFDKEKILHRKYFNPIYDINGNELIGLSPLRPGNRSLTQSVNESDYANRSLLNAGAGGVLVGDAPDNFTDATAGKMKDDVLRELGPAFDSSGSNINANKLSAIFGQWAYLKTSIDPANMQLTEQRRHTFKKLCNLIGISDILFNNSDAGTDNIVKHMVKEGYTNVAIPQVTGLRDTLQKGLAWRYADVQRVIDYDLSDLTEMQEDENAIADKYAALPCFKPNDVRESLGYGRDLGEEGERLIIKQGYSLYDDVVAPLDVTNTDNLKYNDYE